MNHSDGFYLSESFSERIAALRREKRPVKISLIAHRQADPDALCAAGAVARTLEHTYPNIVFENTIIAPQGASALGVSVCEQLKIKFTEKEAEEAILSSDVLIALDMGQPELMAPYLRAFTISRAYKILVDHHGETTSDDLSRYDEVLRDSSSTSTCELLVENLPKAVIDETTARILLTGMMFDSQHLGIATTKTLECVLVLVRKGLTIESVRSVLKAKPSRSEVIARVKGAQRAHFTELGKYVMIDTEVSSFHASVARMMLEIGADVGVAYGHTEGEVRISFRSTQQFFKETSIDLGAELRKAATERGALGEVASAGGHSTAASFTGVDTDPTKITKMIIELIRSKLP